jgi:hypothetical protein
MDSDSNLSKFPVISLACYYPLTLHLEGSNGPSRWRIKDPSIISRNGQDDNSNGTEVTIPTTFCEYAVLSRKLRGCTVL